MRSQYVKPEPDAECRRLQTYLSVTIAQRYGGQLPVRLEVERHTVMAGFLATVHVPGQSRAVYIPEKAWKTENALVREEQVDEVAFAIYQLMDEDEGEK